MDSIKPDPTGPAAPGPANSTDTAAVPARRPTSYDVARLAGVAQSTVSRCFGDDANISPATRARVHEAAARLGYQPNAIARSLITRRSDMVGLLVTRFTLRFSPDLIYVIGVSLAEAGKQVVLVPMGDELPSAGALRRALAFPFDGLISCVTLAEADLRGLRQRRLPVVFFNRTPAGDADSVSASHALSTAGVADALLAAGHRRFLCVAGPLGAPVSEARIGGFVRRLTERGHPAPPVLVSDYSYEGGYDAFLHHMHPGAERPDAVMAANDMLAMGVMDACRYRLDLRVPGDISVVGADDVPGSARPTYELATLAQDLPAMAGEAVRLLLRRIEQPGADTVAAVLPSILKPRASARLGDLPPEPASGNPD